MTDASIDTFLNSLGPVLNAINPTQANEFVENVSGALEGDTAQIDQLINSGATVSSTVKALDGQVGNIIGNLDQVLTALTSRTGDIDTLVTNLQSVSSALASKNTLLDQVVGNLSQVATDLAGLIGNNHSTITSTIDNLQAVAADVQTNQQNLASSLSTPRRRAGALHPDLPVGPVVRRADRLHLPGQPDGVRLLRAEQPAGGLGSRWAARPSPTRCSSSSSPAAPAAGGGFAGRLDPGPGPPGGERRRRGGSSSSGRRLAMKA